MSFFSDLAFAFGGLAFGLAAGFGEAFASSFFLGVGFGSGFGVVLALTAGVALGFGSGVAVAVGFGVAVGNSISLLLLLRQAFRLRLHPFRTRWIQCQWLAALLVAVLVFPFRLPRDLPGHLTTRCSLDSMKLALQHSSGLVLQSARRAPARSGRRFPKNARLANGIF